MTQLLLIYLICIFYKNKQWRLSYSKGVAPATPLILGGWVVYVIFRIRII
jgi:hypothetical protein